MRNFQWHDGHGEPEERLEVFKQILEIQQTKLAPDHADMIATMWVAANNCAVRGRDADAVKVLRDVLKIQPVTLARDDPRLSRPCSRWSTTYAEHRITSEHP